MRTDSSDPWRGVTVLENRNDQCDNQFEDSFVQIQSEYTKLADSEEYLEKLHSRLKSLQKGTSKKDLVSSLSEVKEDHLARLITSGCRLEIEEEEEIASNPLIRHIAPHLQALTTSELVHLLKADILQVTTEAEQEENTQTSLTENQIEHSQSIE